MKKQKGKPADSWFFGCDPGTNYFGWAAINTRRRESHVGRIILPSMAPMAERLWGANYELAKIMQKYPPLVVGIEKSFFNPKRPQAAVMLGRAQAVAMILAESFGAPLMEFPPQTIKKRMTGNCRADKAAVRREVKRWRGGPMPSEDAADGFAVAWTVAAELDVAGIKMDRPAAEIRRNIRKYLEGGIRKLVKELTEEPKGKKK